MNVVGVCMDKRINDQLWRRYELVYTHLITAWSRALDIGMDMPLHTSNMLFNIVEFANGIEIKS